MYLLALGHLRDMKFNLQMPAIFGVDFYVVVQLVLVCKVADKPIHLLWGVQHWVELRLASANLSKRHLEIVYHKVRLFGEKVLQLFFSGEEWLKNDPVVRDYHRDLQVPEQFFNCLSRLFELFGNMKIFTPQVMRQLNFQVFTRNRVGIIDNLFVQKQVRGSHDGWGQLHHVLLLA
jgi:hypothetical protein